MNPLPCFPGEGGSEHPSQRSHRPPAVWSVCLVSLSDSSTARERWMRQPEAAVACSQLCLRAEGAQVTSAPHQGAVPTGHSSTVLCLRAASCTPVLLVAMAKPLCSAWSVPGLTAARLSPVACTGDRSAETLDLVLRSCMQRESHVAHTTTGQRDGCPERGRALEEAVTLLRLALLLAWMLDHDPILCCVSF